MDDNLKQATVMLDDWCSACKKSDGCPIKALGESPSVVDLGLPEEWDDYGCSEFVLNDTDSGDLFA